MGGEGGCSRVRVFQGEEGEEDVCEGKVWEGKVWEAGGRGPPTLPGTFGTG